MPWPAPVSTSTWWPLWMSSRTPDGTRPTRYSWVLISLGMPISMCSLPPVGRPRRVPTLFHRFQHLAQLIEHLVDVGLLDDERRREGDDVAGDADEQAVLIGLQEGVEGAPADLAGERLELDPADETEVAQVDDALHALQGVDGILPILGEAVGALEQALLLIDLVGGHGGGA